MLFTFFILYLGAFAHAREHLLYFYSYGPLCVGQIRLSNTQIIAQKTKLGWILSGMVQSNLNEPRRSTCHFSSNANSHNTIIQR